MNIMMKCYCEPGEKYNEDPIKSDAKQSEVKKLRVELMGGHFSKLPSLENVGRLRKPENDLEKLGGFRKTIDLL